MMNIKAAIIDLYQNEKNEGMRCIKEIISAEGLDYDVYDSRYKNEVPGTGYDIYVSSGGPGNPFDGEGTTWEKKYFKLMDNIRDINQTEDRKKYVFFICHSFQIMARYFKFAEVTARYEKSFGVFPFIKTNEGKTDPVLKALPDPFYAADFRQYQVIQPDNKVLTDLHASIISKEPVIPGHESAVMGVRISNEIVGTQFHPEADYESMMYHFKQKERKESVVNKFGESKFTEMINLIEKPEGIKLTRKTVLPSFLKQAIEELNK
jgi:homoserine O-succinyltransferase/O-acetyltransferase